MIEFKCKDDPEANGRIPLTGEQRFTLIFPFEDGTQIKVHMGKEGFNTFTNFVANMLVDDNNEEEGTKCKMTDQQ